MPSSSSSEGSDFVTKAPCPACGSRDNLAVYTDGHGYCFGCGHYERGDGEPSTQKRERMADKGLIEKGEPSALARRKLTEETCRLWDYTCGTFSGKSVQIANYHDTDGSGVVGQKLRFADKTFTVRGKLRGLYGQHLWRDSGKMVVVTEGEIDALTVSQLQGNKWPVVSVPNGADGAPKAVANALDWLLKFDTVVFMFDNDEPGRKAAQACAELLPPGRAKVATLPAPFKDPSDALQAGQGTKVVDAIWGAKEFRPDGIVAGDDLWDAIEDEIEFSGVALPDFLPGLQEKTHGRRRGEVWVLTSGSGMGKTALAREIAFDALTCRGEKVGMIMLEESVRRTADGFISMELGRPIHELYGENAPTKAERREVFDKLGARTRLYLYDHFGSTGLDNVLNRIRYLAKGCGCTTIVLDHLSIMVSGTATDGDERKVIDEIMTALATVCREVEVHLILISHLRRPPGDKGHEEGARTSLSQLRGSHAIAQLADMVIGLERDQQGDNPNLTLLRVLKNRYTGETGPAGYVEYNIVTGRLQIPEHVPEPYTSGANRGRSQAPDDGDCPF